jgi:hypothetical protein
MLPAALALILASCSTEPADNEGNSAALNAAETPANSSDANALRGPDANRMAAGNDAEATAAADEGAIPSLLQGRWGLVPDDCTSTRGDAKGLLTVGPEELRFYESRARIGVVTERSARRIASQFAFTGEGMEWERRMTLEASADGATLTRSESGEGASPEPLRYARCRE